MPGPGVTLAGPSRTGALVGVTWGAALLGLLLTAWLGFWQLDRAAQKLALQAQIQQRARLPTLVQADLPSSAEAAVQQHYRRVLLQGRWLGQHTVYLDNRQMNARPGFFVVTPLLLADGTAVPVQRGWLGRDFIDRTQLAPVPTPSGTVQVIGRLAPPPSKLFQLGRADAGLIRQNLDLDAWALEIGQPLRPWSVQQADAGMLATAADGPVLADGLQRQWPAAAVDVGKHHGYAFQWFSLCALIAGLAVWFLLLRPRLSARPPDS